MSPFNKEFARHEAQLYRLLSEILDNKTLSGRVYFKGGTCAKMLGFLDRFSVDLDFDLKEDSDKQELRKELQGIFQKLNLKIKDESKNALQFFLRYEAPENERNTIKLEILDKVFKSNDYAPQYLKPIERTAVCQTIETMFANKLVAVMDRFKEHGSIAARDIYDIHHFFMQGYEYKKDIIEERRGVPTEIYLKELAEFIGDKVNNKVINEDLNVLLDEKKFNAVKDHLKRETLNFLS